MRQKDFIVGLGVFLKNGELYLRPVADFVDLQLRGHIVEKFRSLFPIPSSTHFVTWRSNLCEQQANHTTQLELKMKWQKNYA